MKHDSSNCSCTCPDKGGKDNTVVITIETCCRKTCNGKKAKVKDPSVHAIRDPSIPQITTTSPSVHTLAIPSMQRLAVPSVHPMVDPSGLVISGPSIHPMDPSMHAVPVPPPPPPRLFKLPILSERHHGPGCAMEISILEKHEETCVYKKDDVEGRNPIDDRVGSYDVIGRLVFRTCNANEIQSISSGIQTPQPIPITYSHSQVSRHYSAGGISHSNVSRQKSLRERNVSVMSQTDETRSRTSQYEVGERVKSESSQTDKESFHSSDPDNKSPSEIRQELLDKTSESGSHRPSRQSNVISATVLLGDETNEFKEKIYSSRHPIPSSKLQSTELLTVPRKEIRKIAESRKMFPRPSENLSPIPNVASFSYRKKQSEDTITSLLEPPANEQKKSHFFSLFRGKSKDEDDSKSHRRARKKVPKMK